MTTTRGKLGVGDTGIMGRVNVKDWVGILRKRNWNHAKSGNYHTAFLGRYVYNTSEVGLFNANPFISMCVHPNVYLIQAKLTQFHLPKRGLCIFRGLCNKNALP